LPESDAESTEAIRPPCQIAECSEAATDLVRNPKTGTEIQLCSGHAGEFHTPAWEHVAGDAELVEVDNGAE